MIRPRLHTGRPRIDITGQRFGRLVAIQRTNTRGPSVWTCRCDCGRHFETRADYLRNGTSTHCGCSRKPKPHREDVREHDDIERTADLVAEMESLLTGHPRLSRMRILQICGGSLRRLWLATLHPELRSREYVTGNLARRGALA